MFRVIFCVGVWGWLPRSIALLGCGGRGCWLWRFAYGVVCDLPFVVLVVLLCVGVSLLVLVVFYQFLRVRMVLNFSAMLMAIKLILVFILDLFTCGVSWVSFKVL